MVRPGIFVRTAFRGIRRAPLRSILTAVTMGVALAILSAYLLFYQNMESMLAAWGRELDVSIFLSDDITAARREALRELLVARPEVAEVRFVDRARAFERLRRAWPEQAELLAAGGENPAEASFEVRFGNVPDLRRACSDLAAATRGLPGVAAADFGEPELVRVEGTLALLRTIGAVLAAFLSLAALFIAGATVRLALRERREEIEILRLCGATNAFIRAPLYLEGAFQGIAGGALALVLTAALCQVMAAAGAALLGGPGPGGSFPHLTPELAFGVLGGGAVLGALGSALAASRYLRT
jgi:cell division transport system permease protein